MLLIFSQIPAVEKQSNISRRMHGTGFFSRGDDTTAAFQFSVVRASTNNDLEYAFKTF